MANNDNSMTKTVLVAGASGYLGRYLVEEYSKRGWNVIALVRSEKRSPKSATRVVVAQATQPNTLQGTMENVDLVVSALGITRQRDGLTYRQVDYQANVNLLEEALRAGVSHFCYIHVLRGHDMAHLPSIQAKQDFVNRLQSCRSDIQSTIICPCGFFSDMGDFYSMAKSGRVYLFGNGLHRINPIHGADLASATADAIDKGVATLDIGGPDVFTQNELAQSAFDCLEKPARITHIWDGFRKFLICILPWITPLSVYGPVQFFLMAMGMEMVGECHGTRHLRDYFQELADQDNEDKKEK